MKYNDWCAVTVLHGRKDLWTYVTFSHGLKLTQVLTAEKAAAVLKGLRSTPWKEKHTIFGNKEAWKFQP
jgi:hypothetical protein